MGKVPQQKEKKKKIVFFGKYLSAVWEKITFFLVFTSRHVGGKNSFYKEVCRCKGKTKICILFSFFQTFPKVLLSRQKVTQFIT